MYKDSPFLDDRYDAVTIENRGKKFWEEKKVYQYDATRSRQDTFMIDTPPPTVSGSLHIGHIFSYTQTDVIARFQRMTGKTVFYPIGWDDNGLPTERRVQNYFNIACNPNLPYDPNFKPEHIENDKSPRKEVSRKNFIEACEILTNSDEKIFEDVFKNAGHSYDWNLKYTTIGNDTIKLSQESFIDLYEKGYIQSVEAPTMWDTTFQTAVAQAEVEDREVEGFFHDLKFKVEGSDDTFIISTTRPELLPACIGIVAHPDDERYKHLFGKKAIVPLFDIAVDIVPSEHAEIDKGTGIMMVCTFGDSADVAWWKKTGSPLKQIIDMDGRMMKVQYGTYPFDSLNPEKANQNYSQLVGLTTKQAKAKIVELLRADGTLQGEPRRIVHPVKFYEKGNLPLEFVSSRQWFIHLLPEKEAMVKAGREIGWKPAHMQHRFEEWALGLNQDWCISRQRFFGVPFPVWYPVNADGKTDYDHPILADRKQLPVDPAVDVPNGYKEEQRGCAGGFVADKDVMDTWATSALTPQIALDKAKNPNLSLPFDVRPQAHDIIRTWAFYTVAKALLHSKTIPWKEALISGFILDPDRKKMSKSKGNVITPQHLIDSYGADSVRYWAARARLGVDTAFEEQIMSQGKKLVNKIFNACKFVFNIVANSSLKEEANYAQYIQNPMDKSWLRKLSDSLEYATKSFNQYDYAAALDAIESRFWDFCDNYLEIVKSRAYSEDNTSAVASLMKTIDTFILAFAPFVPFIAEEVYQTRTWKKGDESVHNQNWPKVEDFEALQAGDSSLYDTVSMIASEIRKAKTAANKTQRTPVVKVEIEASEKLRSVLEMGKGDIENVGRLTPDALTFKEGKELKVLDVQLDMDFVPEPKKK
ncbi:MAG: valine--tRNA ligase [Alphaproteobacteria bacterium]|nr:valine--tRNA ligase [Alphaproteobacteria bacterium]